MRQGHRYRSETDSETILHAYEEWGEASRATASAACSRSRSGIAAAQRLLARRATVWASSRSTTRSSAARWSSARRSRRSSSPASSAPRRIGGAVPEYLAFGYVSGDNTMFAGIRKLPPGTILTWERGASQITQYWDVQFGPDRPSRAVRGRPHERSARTARRVGRLRLMSDVPLGVFLSGGLDSSAIAAITSRQSAGR